MDQVGNNNNNNNDSSVSKASPGGKIADTSASPSGQDPQNNTVVPSSENVTNSSLQMPTSGSVVTEEVPNPSPGFVDSEDATDVGANLHTPPVAKGSVDTTSPIGNPTSAQTGDEIHTEASTPSPSSSTGLSTGPSSLENPGPNPTTMPSTDNGNISAGFVDSSSTSSSGASFEPTSESKLPKIIGLVVLAVFVIGGFAFVGYYLGSNGILAVKSEPTPSQTIEPIATPTPTPTPDPTASWETYKGSLFTFKYPDKWFYLASPSNTKSEELVSIANYDLEADLIPDSGNKIEVSVVSEDESDYESFLENRVEEYDKNNTIENLEELNSKLTIFGNKVTQITLYSTTSEDYVSELFAYVDGFRVAFVVYAQTDVEVSEIEDIISTFQLVNATTDTE